MKLEKRILGHITNADISIPAEATFALPEKVLQFGTGRLLRGLPDYFIDKANKQGVFNGRIVVIKSTPKGNTQIFDRQDGLYTICERGVTDGKEIERNIISSAISRVLDAHKEWNKILECAGNDKMKIIVSNTTEVGIQLSKSDQINDSPPSSFPGKILAFLYQRFLNFKGSSESGMVIIPTELIPDNGNKLKSIVIELAHINHIDGKFINWLNQSNHFCSSLVDRIVTGMPEKEIRNKIETKLGYEDDLLIVSEIYSLWAIEGDNDLKEVLSFHKTDKSIKIEPDITRFRELKLRLLNGTHTLTCGLAFLAGYETVKQTMQDDLTSDFISLLMKKEIGTSIPYKIDKFAIEEFIQNVLDRFRNPHINHLWKNITFNYSSKMQLRCIPILKRYYENNQSAPQLFSLGFAAFLYFMKSAKRDDKGFYGILNGTYYLIDDDNSAYFYSLWQNKTPEELVHEVLSNTGLWGENLTLLPGFQKTITEYLTSIIHYGAKETLKNTITVMHTGK